MKSKRRPQLIARSASTLLLATLLGLVMPVSPSALIGSGRLDPSFGGDGRVITTFETGSEHDSFVSGLAAQADGKLVVAGTAAFYMVGLARYEVDGSLDASFGVNGKVITDAQDFCIRCFEAHALDVAIQADGKIVAVGYVVRDDDHFFSFVIRYNPDGSPDGSFGTNGAVVTNLARAEAGEYFSAVAIQTDAKILAAGAANQRKFALARYDGFGNPDGSFGDGGKAIAGLVKGSKDLNDMVVQPNGKIVVAGGAYQLRAFLVARYVQDGTLDTSFSRDGIQITNFAEGAAGANGLAIQADGRILAAGGAGGRFAVARYRRHGRLDVSFGDDGKITTRFWSRPAAAFAVVIQLNGKIVMAGGGGRLARSKFALARYRPGGKLDPTFGRGGRVTTQFAAGPATALTLAAVAGGKIAAAGEAGGRFALARYFLHPA